MGDGLGLRRGLQRVFWRLVAAGVSSEVAARRVGLSAGTGTVWFRQAGGMAPLSLQEPRGWFLGEAEREKIEDGPDAGLGIRVIAGQLGRPASTVSREIKRNTQPRQNRGPERYRARRAQRRADREVARPKESKLATNARLRARVQAKLNKKWSPEQIAGWLRRRFPDDPEMQVSPETIYRALYVQGRGGLRRELHKCLRTGRALRKPRQRADRRRSQIKNMIMIADRPAEAADRAVPGHWEGDLILGKHNASAIGTLVERATRFCLLLHLPHGHGAEAVRDAMIAKITELPDQLWRSLTWDQGIEMAKHHEITMATGLPIYFCDPHSPWQRGTNENTNGLLRQYLPKGTDLSFYGPGYLDLVAAELNARPRKTLDWHTPAEALNQLLSEPFNPPGVAKTG